MGRGKGLRLGQLKGRWWPYGEMKAQKARFVFPRCWENMSLSGAAATTAGAGIQGSGEGRPVGSEAQTSIVTAVARA